jgi:hypothetical protein
MANFNSWRDIYEIVHNEDWPAEESLTYKPPTWLDRVKEMFGHRPNGYPKCWHVIDIASRTIVGVYDSKRYAENRAKLKFKRHMRMLDRMLLSRAE